MSKEEQIKDIVEILELAKEEIENNNENLTAILDLQDLKSLKNLYDLYNREKENNEYLRNHIYNPTVVKLNYIHKDKIRERYEQLKHYDYIEIKELLKLLEE